MSPLSPFASPIAADSVQGLLEAVHGGVALPDDADAYSVWFVEAIADEVMVPSDTAATSTAPTAPREIITHLRNTSAS